MRGGRGPARLVVHGRSGTFVEIEVHTTVSGGDRRVHSVGVHVGDDLGLAEGRAVETNFVDVAGEERVLLEIRTYFEVVIRRTNRTGVRSARYSRVRQLTVHVEVHHVLVRRSRQGEVLPLSGENRNVGVLARRCRAIPAQQIPPMIDAGRLPAPESEIELLSDEYLVARAARTDVGSHPCLKGEGIETLERARRPDAHRVLIGRVEVERMVDASLSCHCDLSKVEDSRST
ncbi:unannotated protein [freshwater metagenome]|uniref:Unannotated protein n=1 Tax=freshwater metagenome TaxID=449393 RepID=A0A6J6ENT3_9ZZZZ